VVPSETQLVDAGVRLGLIAPGDPVPPRLRGKLAKIVADALAADAEAAARTDRTAATTAPLIDTYQALAAAGVDIESCGRITAALAPHIWRSIEGATR
jgi:hypothetical protein